MRKLSLLGILAAVAVGVAIGGVATVVAPFIPRSILDSTSVILESNLTTALAGAFFGAYGAHWIAKRSERQRRLIEEIRSTNAAIMLAFHITSVCCSLKEQHVRSLKETFDKQEAEFNAYRLARKAGEIPQDQLFDMRADFETLNAVAVPIEPLKALLFEKVAATRRPLLLIATLSQTLVALAEAIAMRNELVADYKQRSPMPPNELIPLYFGLPDKHRRIDRRYRSCVDGIYRFTDDCIFFAKLLCEDLTEHGDQLAAAYGRNAPYIERIDFTKPAEKQLIPDPKDYRDWTTLPKA